MSDPTPAAGWYPAPHANNEQRYWDGTGWLEAEPAAATAVLDAPPPYVAPAPEAKKPELFAIGALVVGIIAILTGIVPIVGAIIGLAAITLGVFTLLKKQKKGFGITGIVLGAIAVISSISVTAGISANLPDTAPAPASTSQSETVDDPEPTPTEEPVVMVTIPDVTGMTAGEAVAALTTAGLDVATPIPDATAKVLSTSPAAGSETEEGTVVTLTVEEKPKLTLGQQNAVDKAQQYLSIMGMSRTGLIDQLKFEGFSVEDATFGTDNAGADWNAECAEKAQQYLDTMSMSRDGLADQLAFEGFQQSEIDFGLAAVGY